MASLGGAPKGNHNAAKGRLWRSAIERALAQRSKGDMVKSLDKLAEKLLLNCDDGDISALRELGDRLDGKAAQALQVEGNLSHTVVKASSLDENL